MIFDTQTLTRIIERGFELSMNGSLPPEVRAEYLAHGKRLREQLVRLLGARFDAEAAEFKKATATMHETHHALAQAADDLNEVLQVVGRLGELASDLEQALEVAGRVIA